MISTALLKPAQRKRRQAYEERQRVDSDDIPVKSQNKEKVPNGAVAS